MRVRLRRALLADLWIWIPDRIEQYKHDANVMLFGDPEESVHTVEKTGGILFPCKVVQEHTHGVHTDVLRPAEFAIDCCEVEGVGLPHFQFVDRSRWDEIAADKPWLRFVPVVGMLHGPAIFCRVFRCRRFSGSSEWHSDEEQKNQTCAERSKSHFQCSLVALGGRPALARDVGHASFS